MNEFFIGFKLPFQAIREMRKSPRLLGLTLLCALITLGVIVSVVAFVYANAETWLAFVWSKPDERYLKALWYVAWGLVIVFVSLVGIQTLPIVLLAPFQDFISEATDEVLGKRHATPFSLGLWLKNTFNALFLNLARVSVYLAGFLLLWLLHFIPGLGGIAFGACTIVWGIFWVSFEFLGGVMSRWGFRFGEVTALMWANKPEAFGYGTSIYLLTWIPLLNLLVMPLAVISATMLYWHLATKTDRHLHAGE